MLSSISWGSRSRPHRQPLVTCHSHERPRTPSIVTSPLPLSLLSHKGSKEAHVQSHSTVEKQGQAGSQAPGPSTVPDRTVGSSGSRLAGWVSREHPWAWHHDSADEWNDKHARLPAAPTCPALLSFLLMSGPQGRCQDAWACAENSPAPPPPDLAGGCRPPWFPH